MESFVDLDAAKKIIQSEFDKLYDELLGSSAKKRSPHAAQSAPAARKADLTSSGEILLPPPAPATSSPSKKRKQKDLSSFEPSSPPRSLVLDDPGILSSPSLTWIGEPMATDPRPSGKIRIRYAGFMRGNQEFYEGDTVELFTGEGKSHFVAKLLSLWEEREGSSSFSVRRTMKAKAQRFYTGKEAGLPREDRPYVNELLHTLIVDQISLECVLARCVVHCHFDSFVALKRGTPEAKAHTRARNVLLPDKELGVAHRSSNYTKTEDAYKLPQTEDGGYSCCVGRAKDARKFFSVRSYDPEKDRISPLLLPSLSAADAEKKLRKNDESGEEEREYSPKSQKEKKEKKAKSSPSLAGDRKRKSSVPGEGEPAHKKVSKTEGGGEKKASKKEDKKVAKQKDTEKQSPKKTDKEKKASSPAAAAQAENGEKRLHWRTLAKIAREEEERKQTDSLSLSTSPIFLSSPVKPKSQSKGTKEYSKVSLSPSNGSAHKAKKHKGALLPVSSPVKPVLFRLLPLANKTELMVYGKRLEEAESRRHDPRRKTASKGSEERAVEYNEKHKLRIKDIWQHTLSKRNTSSKSDSVRLAVSKRHLSRNLRGRKKRPPQRTEQPPERTNRSQLSALLSRTMGIPLTSSSSSHSPSGSGTAVRKVISLETQSGSSQFAAEFHSSSSTSEEQPPSSPIFDSLHVAPSIPSSSVVAGSLFSASNAGSSLSSHSLSSSLFPSMPSPASTNGFHSALSTPSRLQIQTSGALASPLPSPSRTMITDQSSLSSSPLLKPLRPLALRGSDGTRRASPRKFVLPSSSSSLSTSSSLSAPSAFVNEDESMSVELSSLSSGNLPTEEDEDNVARPSVPEEVDIWSGSQSIDVDWEQLESASSPAEHEENGLEDDEPIASDFPIPL